MKDTTLVIQGNIKQDSYKFYCQFYPDVKKVFSTWIGNDKTMGWSTSKDRHGPDDFFIESQHPYNIGVHARNLQLQVVSTLIGLRRVRTKYVIKLRGDEWYSNLSSVEPILENDQEKIFTGPVFFRRWDVYPFHPSDHMMASTTENMKGMFTNCLLNILSQREFLPEPANYEDTNLLHQGGPMPPECVLGKSYMNHKGSNQYGKEEFKRLFGIIPLSNLVPYKVSANCIGRCWYSNFDPRNDGLFGSISSIDDL